jgi:hypothetical protein
MRRLPLIAGLCLITAGCGAGSPEDEVAVYEAVLRKEVGEQRHVADVFLHIDGQDPSKEMLDRFVKKFPAIQPGSKAPKGKATHVSLSELKWINSSTAEVKGGFSNGLDGRHSLYRVVRKKGEWVVEKAEVKAIS